MNAEHWVAAMTEIVVTRYNGGSIITAMGLSHILQRSHNMILIVMQARYSKFSLSPSFGIGNFCSTYETSTVYI